ncbi:helix-turn-helix domain-containing protein [Bradyrhizobium sp. USDA 10063]
MARRDTGNRTNYWQSRRIPGLSLLRADFTAHQFAPHTHDAFVIAVTEAGGAEITSRGITEQVGAATLFVSNPEERQSSRMASDKRWLYRSFYLTRSAIDAIGDQLGARATPYFMQNMFDDAELIKRFGRLHRALEADQDDALTDELAICAFSALFERYGHGGDRPERAPQDRAIVARVVDLMQARYAENLGLSELARVAGLTQFQLIGLFKRTVGLTPHAYLVHIRLNAACRLLKRGTPLAEAALAAGFCDQSALTKHFRRCYAITPAQFAAAARATEPRDRNFSQYP